MRILHLEVPLYGLREFWWDLLFCVIKPFNQFFHKIPSKILFRGTSLWYFVKCFLHYKIELLAKFPDRLIVSGAGSEKAAKAAAAAQPSERCGSCAAGSAASAYTRRWKLSSRSLSTRTCRPGRGRGRGSRLLGSAPTTGFSKKCAAFSPDEVGRTNTFLRPHW